MDRKNAVTVTYADGQREVRGAGSFGPHRLPTRKQRLYIHGLCKELGIPTERPDTREAAKGTIRSLKARRSRELGF